jgi:5-methyltetrahydrofolate--homocysteine methyltransferase
MDALNLVLTYDTQVIVTASGSEGMPDGSEQRIEFASRMVDAALAKGISLAKIYVDALVFPISVDGRFGLHYLDAVKTIRDKYGPEIHLTGGLSNVSFGLPKRKIINDVFINLAVESGADGGIVDPVSSQMNEIFGIDWNKQAYRITREMLLGQDEHCANYLAAYRNQTLDAV